LADVDWDPTIVASEGWWPYDICQMLR